MRNIGLVMKRLRLRSSNGIGVISAFGFLYKLASALNRYYTTKAEGGENSFRASDRFLNEFFAMQELVLRMDKEVHGLRARVGRLESYEGLKRHDT